MYSIKGYGIDMNGSDIAYDEKEGVVIYSDVYPTESAKAVNPKLTLKVNTAGTLELTLPPGNAGYKRLRKMVSEIVVYRDNVERWSGRIIGQKFDFNNNEILTCEGELAYLNDTTQPPNSYNKTIKQFLETLINEHNNQIDTSVQLLKKIRDNAATDEEKININAVIAFEEKKKFTLGSVEMNDTGEDGSENIHEFVTNDKDTLSTISEQLVDQFGGYLIIHKVQNERKLDYKIGGNAESASSQQIRFGLNLLDYTKNWDLTDLVTVIIPRGASLDDFTTSELIDIYNKPYTEIGRKEYLKEHNLTEAEYVCQTPKDQEMEKPSVTGMAIPMDRTGVKLTKDGREIYFANSWGGFWRDYWNKRKEGGEHGSSSDSDKIESYGAYLDLTFGQSKWTLENCDKEPEIEYGDRYVASEEAIKQFGWICAVVDFEDIKDPYKLREEAEKYLADKQFGEMILEVTSIDLRYLGVVDEADSIRLLDTVRCISAPHGLDKEMLVTELTIELDKPDNSTYTMTSEKSKSGETISTFTESTVSKAESKQESKNVLNYAFSAATNIINSATRGHVTITRDVNGTEALYIIDNSAENGDPLWNFNPQTGYWGEPGDHIEMWKWNLGGLGWSTDGGRTFEGLAMTNDGAIVANRITTGILTAITIQSYDGQSYWNLGKPETDGDVDEPQFYMTNGTIQLGSGPKGAFRVDSKGELYSVSGTIGGFHIASDMLYNEGLQLDDGGLTFFRYINDEVKNVGTFGANYWIPDPQNNGIVMNLSRDQSFISFGYNRIPGEETESKLFYVSPAADMHYPDGIRKFENDKWYFGCDVDHDYHTIVNASINDCYIDPNTAGIFFEGQGGYTNNNYTECWVEFITGIDFGSHKVAFTKVTFMNGFVTKIEREDFR